MPIRCIAGSSCWNVSAVLASAVDLLYVAATRAKRVLHLLGTVDVKETEAGASVQSPATVRCCDCCGQR